MYGVRTGALITILLLFPFFSLVPDGPQGAEGGSSYPLFDPGGDTTRAHFIERRVSGHQDIDIVSLVTYQAPPYLVAGLTVAGEVNERMGFIYSMSIGGVNIFFDNGTTQAWKGDSGEPLSGVEVDVEGNGITAQIPVTYVDRADFRINATAQERTIGPTQEREMENFFDLVEDTGPGTGGNPLVMDLKDVRSDVVQSYLERERSSKAHLDILSLNVNLGEGFEAELVLKDDAVSSSLVTYSVWMGSERMLWNDGKAERFGGGNEGALDVAVSGRRIVFSSDVWEGGDDGVVINATAMEKAIDGSWFEDSAPDEPWRYTSQLPFQMGGEVSVEITFDGKGTATLKRRFSGFNEDAEWIRDISDGDGSGAIEEAEIEGLFAPIIDRLNGEGNMFPLSLTGYMESRGAALSHKGLLGSTDSSEPIEIELVYTYTVSSIGKTCSIDVQPWTSNEEGDEFTTKEVSVGIMIAAGEDWRIDPMTLDPTLLSNYLLANGSAVEFEGAGLPALFFAGQSYHVELYRYSPPTDDDVKDGSDDRSWLIYLFAAIVLFASIIAGGVWWWRNREE